LSVEKTLMPIQFLVGLLRSLLNPMLTMYLITTLIALTVVAFTHEPSCVSRDAR